MIGTIRFEYDEQNDIHIAYPKWFVETENDCRIWHKQFEDYFGGLPAKVDVIYVTDGFRIGPKIGPQWGKYRADLNNRFTRHSVRVHVDARVAAFTATSGVIYGASSDEAPDVPTAISIIKERRRVGGAAGAHRSAFRGPSGLFVEPRRGGNRCNRVSWLETRHDGSYRHAAWRAARAASVEAT